MIDADDGADLFDFVGGVDYRRTLRRAKITREYNCSPSVREQDRDTCPEAINDASGTLLQVKELRYERVTHEIVPQARFGLWHDLELKIEAPIVISDDQTIRFAGDGGDSNSAVITPENSSIAPGAVDGEDPENLFDVPTEGLPTRAGFGDMLFMLRYSPIAQERDDLRSDWTIEFGYRAPTGKAMELGNEDVGRGVHELIVATSLSRRFTYIDPYGRIEAVFPIPSDDSLFKDYGDSSEHVGPGNRVSFDFGTEVVPYEDKGKGMKFFIDLGLGARYQAEGRDYTELFDALAIGGQTCDRSNPNSGANCGTYNPDSRSQIAGQAHDGITTVEEYMTLGAHLGFGVHIRNYVRLGASLSIAHDTEHFLSSADIGKDLDGSGLVEAKDGADARYNPEEHNPTFVPAIDNVGRRLRVEESTIFTAGAHLLMSF